MFRTYRTEGIVLKRINVGEADKIITIFTKHHGKIRCLAKGIRKLTSRKSASLELFNHVILFLAKGKNIDLITETQLVNSFPQHKKDLKKVATAYEFTKLIDCFEPDNQENHIIFELLKSCLANLVKPGINMQNLEFDFKVELLRLSGFGLPAKLTMEVIDDYIEKIIEKRVKYFYE